MKILVVDDKQDNLYYLETLLEAQGHQISTAENGLEALNQLRAAKFDLIISDILMPEMDGYQLCMECKKDKLLKDVPFVFYTATYTDAKDEEFALHLGADKFIRKPLEPDKFIEYITEIINTSKAGKKRLKRAVLKPKTEAFKMYSQRLVKKLEHKMFEKEMAEKKYHALCNIVPDFIFSLDSEGRFDTFNRGIELFGYEQNEIKGNHLADFLTPQGKSIIQNYLKETREFKKVKQIELEQKLLKKDNSWADIELGLTSFIDENGEFTIFGAIKDITKTRLREKEYKQLLDGMNDTVFVIGFDGKFLEVNKSAVNKLGYRRSELLDMGPADIDTQLESSDIDKLISGMKSDKMQVFETKHQKKDGTIFPVEISSSHVTYQGKEAVLSVARDITQRFKAEEELRKYRQHLEELVQERTKELEKTNKQLQEFNQIFVGREFRIKELRDRVKELEEEKRNL
jgi:PAS domain S-box-containing protein